MKNALASKDLCRKNGGMQKLFFLLFSFLGKSDNKDGPYSLLASSP